MKPRQQGFTLIELAIVMLVLTILAAGLLVPLTTSIETRRIAETNNSMATIQDALIGYAMSHRTASGRPYLPCPDTNNDGMEEARDAAGYCPASRGGLPWITLGVKGDDAWGNRYTYAADLRFYSNNQSGFVSTPT
ncbi:MAG TPA: type II secretion system protein, partial [Thiobacillaceae bacterium]|nr:type II secretion system protein [Thiobacillaceae bacterium]